MLRFRHSHAAVAVVLGMLISSAVTAADTAPATDAENGSIWWNELVSQNPETSRDFYQSVIGWSPRIVAADDQTRPPAPGEDEYTVFMHNGSENAGLTEYDQEDTEEPKPGWLMYVQVRNVDDASAEAVRKGGKLIRPPYDVASVGRMSVIEDPDGNAIGLVTPASGGAKQ